MTVIDDLLSNVSFEPEDLPAQDLAIGLFWTAVHGRRVGLAATPPDSSCCYADDVAGTGQLQCEPIRRLANRLRSSHPLDRALGMAALNASTPVNEANGIETNARDLLLDRGRDKTVVTVGHFPFSDALRSVAARLFVLELDPAEGDYPAEAAPELIPQADVIGLTASTLINGTFDSLWKLFPSRALVVMLGPSTPFSPVLFDYGVHMLGGALVTDPELLLRYVTQGSSLRHVPGLRRFTLMKK